MKETKRVLLIINWKEEGKWDLYRDLRACIPSLHILQPCKWSLFQKGLMKKINLYLAEFYLPLMAACICNRYDIIVSWTMRIGTLFGIIKMMFGSLISSKHVIYDFHINHERTDLLYSIKLFLTKAATKGIDYFLTTSTKEEILYSEMFNIPRTRIKFFPIAPPKYFFDHSSEVGNYIFSYGNSDRDYDTLVKAVDGLPFKLVILSQAYVPKRPLPKNIVIITQPHYGIDLVKLILGSRMVVLPLVSYNVSAGQTAFLESMALGRTVIIAENMATVEYAVNGESAFFYKAGDSNQLRELIKNLFPDVERLRSVGKNAKEIVSKLPKLRVDILRKLFYMDL